MSGRHYSALVSMHRDIQNQIDAEEKALRPDWSRVQKLKRLKLAVRDRMRRVLEDNARTIPMAPRRPDQRATAASDA